MTQVARLYDHMLTERKITPMQAEHIYGVRSFHRRMADLRALGMRFNKTRKQDHTGAVYVEYQFAGVSL